MKIRALCEPVRAEMFISVESLMKKNKVLYKSSSLKIEPEREKITLLNLGFYMQWSQDKKKLF